MNKRAARENDAFIFFGSREKQSLFRSLKASAEYLFYSLLVRIDAPKRNVKRKYHISLCIMFKDEAPYLREWIEYHRMIGVDHFYLYDNNSSDGYEAVIRPYTEEGAVTLIRWPQEHAQAAGYEDCIRKYQSESDWIGFIDADEFLVPTGENSLADFLERFSRRPAVRICWRLFGSGGRLSRDVSRLVTEDFTVACGKLYTHGKCFFNSDYDYLFDSPRNRSMFHKLWTVSHGIPVPPVDCFGHPLVTRRFPARRKRKIPIQINHYAVKSLEEHRKKDLKGDVFFDHPTHSDDVFFKRDRLCSVPDYSIMKYVSELKFRLQEREKSE